MQGVVLRCLLVGAIAACHTDNPGTADGSTDGTGSNTAGLSINWSTHPTAIPGQANSDTTIASMTFRVANLRVIGDAGPGDDRTSIDTLALQWQAGVQPSPISFADAPTGLYSRVVLLADGNLVDYSYELAGTTKVDGMTLPYQIHDRSPLGISLETSTMLDPDHGASLVITIRIDQALQSLDFSKLDNQNGTLVLDTFDDAMGDFRNKMMSAVFEASHNTGGD